MDNTKWFLDSNRNDSFSKLNDNDLYELLVGIENNELLYRDKLSLSDDCSLGLEMEYERISKLLVDIFIKIRFSNWKSKKDFSLDSGGEIISPILHNRVETWKDLKTICNYLKKHKANMDNNAGGHIHVGSHPLGDNPEYWIIFIKMLAGYENILWRFCYGNKTTPRRKMSIYAEPIAERLCHGIKLYLKNKEAYNMDNVRRIVFPIGKFGFVNFEHVDFSNNHFALNNTIEYRGPNATTNEITIQNNFNAMGNLTEAPTRGIIDHEFLDYKLNSIDHIFPWFNEIDLKSALELVDFIFDNNLDKFYFLSQYIRSFGLIAPKALLKRKS